MKFFRLCISIFILFQLCSGKRRCPSQDAILPCRCLIRGEDYQIWCSHSDLPRVLESLKSLSQYIQKPIDELIIENNILPSLPGRTFYHLKILRLMLRHNNLERVSSDWLAGLDSLMEIFIVEPQLRSLPDDSLVKLSALQAVTIQSQLLKRLPTFSGLANLRYIQVESQSLLELSPTSFNNMPKLNKVHISDIPRLTKLEANVFNKLPELDLINITNCSLSWMHPRSLSRLAHLRELNLVRNKFVEADIVGRVIRVLPDLQILHLDYNYIERIGKATFVDLPSLKKIFLSNNRITELQHGAFHRLPSLKTMDLSKNFIQRIHPNSFLSSDNGLEELLLVDNKLSYIGEIRSLFDALPNLVFIDLRHNHLEAIPYGALRGHPTLEHINLGYNRLRLIDKEAFMAMPALRELRLKNNSLSEDLQFPIWNLPALKGLDLSENFFRRLEPALLDNLPSLRRIDFSQNELNFIDPSAFLSTKNLEHINISHNNLKVLHPATFRHLLHLYELDASFNQLLEFIPGLPRGIEYLHLKYNSFQDFPLQPSPDLDLPSLKMLDVSGNKIQNIAKGSLITLPQLRKLYLAGNLLQALDESALDGLNRLEILDLQRNRLVYIHPKSLNNMPDLNTINLKSNVIDLLPPDLFKSTRKLKILHLNINKLAELPPGIFEENPRLETIDESNNGLVKFPQNISNLQYLQILNLNNNRIKIIDPGIISSMSTLKELKLSKNFIQELREGTFLGMKELIILDIDNNEIEIIEPNAIKLLPKLKSINLNDNKIKEIPNLAFNKLPSLQIINLENNQISIIAPNAFNIVPRLLFLNMSHNNIYDAEEAGLRSVHSLEVLDLSYNKISRLSNGYLGKMEWLVELRMDNNNICRVNGAIFNNMPRLRLLSLRNNRLTSFPEHAVQRLRSNIAIVDIDGNPLTCSCNLLWLQSWLKEASQIGPRCMDGTLVREMHLTIDECSDEQRNLDMSIPNCEAELLTGNLGTTQVLAKWTSNNESSKAVLRDKNELPPTPEESDYFYDEYVDYPLNESLIEQVDIRDNEGVTEVIKSITSPTTKSPHHITGNTPTIYAASKSKSKPNIPHKVSDSPSTSGFTFFGIPLNNILGSFGRKQDGNPIPATAQRKTAIVGRNTERVGMGNMQSNLPYMRNVPATSVPVNMRPPMAPELHGGFLPILPPDGGFKPIPDPNLLLPTSSNSTKKNKTQKLTSAPPSLHPKDKNYSQRQNLTKNSIKDNQTIPSLKNAYSLDNKSVLPPILLTTKEEKINKTSIKRTTMEKTHYLSSKIISISSEQKDSNKSTFINETTDRPNERNISLISLSTEASSTAETTTNKLLLSATETSVKTKQETASTTVITPVNDSINKIENVETGRSTDYVSTTKTPAIIQPALLIPGGQQPLYKVGGRSTITKIPSPHIAQSSPLQSPKIYNESRGPPMYSARDFIDIPDPQSRIEDGVTHESVSYIDRKTDDWYFANYNKTNLKPYVSKITSPSGVQKQSAVNIHVVTIGNFITLYYVLLY